MPKHLPNRHLTEEPLALELGVASQFALRCLTVPKYLPNRHLTEEPLASELGVASQFALLCLLLLVGRSFPGGLVLAEFLISLGMN